MEYVNGYYICEECFCELNFEDIINYRDILINWDKFKQLIENSNTPKKIIKILVNKIYRIQYTPEEIDFYYNLIKKGNTLTLDVFLKNAVK
jgi:hypothetical protein